MFYFLVNVINCQQNNNTATVLKNLNPSRDFFTLINEVRRSLKSVIDFHLQSNTSAEHRHVWFGTARNGWNSWDCRHRQALLNFAFWTEDGAKSFENRQFIHLRGNAQLGRRMVNIPSDGMTERSQQYNTVSVHIKCLTPLVLLTSVACDCSSILHDR